MKPMVTRHLTHAMLRFIVEYMAVMPRDATAAYRRVYEDNGDGQSAASQLMQNPAVIAEIEKREREFKADGRMTAGQLAHLLLLRATADPRELCEIYQAACRHCHGAGHRYQFTKGEFERDLETHIKRMAKTTTPDPLGIEFNTKGGIGYDPRKPPHPDCTECHGEGVERQVFKDTSNLSPSGVALYAGIERKREGIRIRMHDQMQAANMLAQHLSFYKYEIQHSGPGGGPIQTANISAVTTDPVQAAALYQKLMGG